MSEANAMERIGEHRATLVALLDEIVPPSADGRMPGAGAIGVADHVVKTVAEQPPQQSVIADGLSALEDAAMQRGAADFASLAREDRIAVMRELEQQPTGFIQTLVFLTFTGYYQQSEVVAALGLESWPPYPGGFPIGESDPALVEPVVARGKIYRE